MGYPIRYRGRRSPQRAGPRGLPAALTAEPPLAPGPWMGAAMFAYAGWHLAQSLTGLQPGVPSRQDPASYGWTLAFACGFPQVRLPSGARNSCGLTIFSPSAWRSNGVGINNPLNPTTGMIYYYPPYITDGYFNGVNPRVQIAARWDRNIVGSNFSSITITPPARPGTLLGGPLPLQARIARGESVVGYHAPAMPVPGRLPGFDILDNRWVITLPGRPGSVPQERPDSKPLPRPVPRTVPAPLMKEVKVNLNSRAGRAFVAMYSMFNLLGDAQGFTRALWFALPKEDRGSSMRWRNMARDLWRGAENIDWLKAAKNVAQWKFLDTLYGGTQGAMFEAIGRGYGYDLARVWSTLDSEINATWGYEIRRLEREQQSSRGG